MMWIFLDPLWDSAFVLGSRSFMEKMVKISSYSWGPSYYSTQKLDTPSPKGPLFSLILVKLFQLFLIYSQAGIRKNFNSFSYKCYSTGKGNTSQLLSLWAPITNLQFSWVSGYNTQVILGIFEIRLKLSISTRE